MWKEALMETRCSIETTSVFNKMNDLPTSLLRCAETIAQIYGATNRCITKNLQDLECYCERKLVSIMGVTENIEVNCTRRGIYCLIARSWNLIYIIMHYSPTASHAIVSPNDTFSASTIFTSWAQNSDMSTGKGFVIFISSSGLITECIDLTKHNKWWFLSNPR